MRHGVKKVTVWDKLKESFRTDRKIWIIGAACAAAVILAVILISVTGGGKGKLSGGARWEFDRSGILTISGEGSTGDMDLAGKAPAWAKYASRITTVIVEEGVTGIGKSAFDGDFLPEGQRYAMTQVILPESLTEIGDCAFYNCVYLEEVAFEEKSSLTRIGNSAFYGCTSLQEIRLPDGVSEIGEGAFEDCAAMTFAGIPGTVKSLYSAFAGCTNLSQVILGEGLEDIGYGTFSYCEKLTRVDLPMSLQRIGEYAFWYSGLTELTVPAAVTELGEALLESALR